MGNNCVDVGVGRVVVLQGERLAAVANHFRRSP
jgi:hypothetical protein